jgi:ubiquitin-like 1-activating enzyme E1 A
MNRQSPANTIQRAEAAAPEVKKMNPRVQVNVMTTNIMSQQDPSFYEAFDVIIATDLDFNSLATLDAGARVGKRPFYAGANHGFYGYIFADLGSHDYVIERALSNLTTAVGPETATRSIIDIKKSQTNGKTVELVTKRELYSPLLLANTSPLSPEMQKSARKLRKVHPLLTCVRTLWDYQRNHNGIYPDTQNPADLQLFTELAMDKHKELKLPPNTLTGEFLKAFLTNLGCELSPVSGYLGGQLAQDVINLLGKREQPIQNLLLFDGDECEAPVYALHPIFPNNPVVPLTSVLPVHPTHVV